MDRMTTRLLAISLVMLPSLACVVITDPDDAEVGDGDGDTGDSTATDSTATDTGSTSTDSDSTDSSSTDADTSSTDSDSTDTDIPPGDCSGVGSSDLAGVCIWFPSPGESWTLAEVGAGITIPYHVIVEADVAEVIPQPQDDGGCGQPDASGLIVFALLQGGGQEYCLCDVGICPLTMDPVTIPAGDTPLEFDWNGVNWGGPSDTNNPFGPAFPAGEYTLEVNAIGTVGGVAFEVRNSFAVTLTE